MNPRSSSPLHPRRTWAELAGACAVLALLTGLSAPDASIARGAAWNVAAVTGVGAVGPQARLRRTVNAGPSAGLASGASELATAVATDWERQVAGSASRFSSPLGLPAALENQL